MSEQASAIIVLDTPRTAVVKAVAELDLPTWVAPARGARADRVVVFPDGNPERIVRALGVHLRLAPLVAVVAAEAGPTAVSVHRQGAAVVAVKLDPGAPAAAVERASAQLGAALGLRGSAGRRAAAGSLRDVLARLLDVADDLARQDFVAITRGAAEDPAAFVGFTYVHDTRVRELTADDVPEDDDDDHDHDEGDEADGNDDDDDDELAPTRSPTGTATASASARVMAALLSPSRPPSGARPAAGTPAPRPSAGGPVPASQAGKAAAGKAGGAAAGKAGRAAAGHDAPAGHATAGHAAQGGKGGKGGKKEVLRIPPAEAAELSATFAHARTDLARPAPVAGAERQLATAANASEWLAVRRTIDPARITAEVMSELVDVIRAGRFPREGERAQVVREAAAMLLGRALKAQRATAATVSALRAQGPGCAEERACWEIVLRMAGLGGD